MTTYIIEHLEPRLWRWCLIEYKHISELVGKQNCWFTNVRSKKLNEYGKTFLQSVTTLPLTNACVLDPEEKKALTPLEAKRFDYFIFGGILGNDPPEKRTAPELTTKFSYPVEIRNLGTKQMSTDTAVAVVKEIVGGKSLEDLPFRDGIEIELRRGESVQFPYRYLLVKGKPLVSNELVAYLRKKKGL